MQNAGMNHLFLSVVVGLVGMMGWGSCTTVPEASQRTDAMQYEVLHGVPRMVRTVSYPAHSSAGEWFKDTTVGEVPVLVHTFDEQGNLLTEETSLSDSLPTSVVRYEYVAGTRCKEVAVGRLDTLEMIRIRYHYNQNQQLVGMEYTQMEEGSGREEYELNRKGYPVEVRRYRDNGILTYRAVKEYNRAGQLTHEDIYWYVDEGEKPVHTVRYSTYQGNGLAATLTVQHERSDPKETRTVYTYEYDAHGNWIRRVEYNETLKTAWLTERHIEYYQ